MSQDKTPSIPERRANEKALVTALAARVKHLEDAIRDANSRLYSIIDIEPRTIEDIRARLRAALADHEPPTAVNVRRAPR